MRTSTDLSKWIRPADLGNGGMGWLEVIGRAKADAEE